MRELLNGWETVDLNSVCEVLDSQRVPINSRERSERIAGKATADLFQYYGATGQVGWIDDYLFDGEFILLGEDGAPFLDHTKDTAYIAFGKFWVNNHAHILRAITSNKYLCYFLNQVNFREFVTGTTRLKLNQTQMKNILVKYAPENEQHRIVAKIEELFSELEKGVESLKTAREKLKVYRQSVLKAAFEGRLTESWRKEHADELESADELLACIKTEREARYAAQLAEWQQAVEQWQAAGKPGKKPTKPKKPKELPPLTADELADLPELPEGWGWSRFGNAFAESVLGKMLDKQKNQGEMMPYLRNQNVRWGGFDLSDVSAMRFETGEYARYGLESGDLVVCEGGEPGRCAIWLGQASEMRIQKALHRVRFHPETILGNYVSYFIQFSATNGHLARFFTGTTIKHLTGNGLQEMQLPICDCSEQHQIVQEIESRFSVVEQMEQAIEESLQKAEALRQSVLKRAFKGKLVPQDPSDEPAFELLARIRAERATVPRSRGRKRKEAAA